MGDDLIFLDVQKPSQPLESKMGSESKTGLEGRLDSAHRRSHAVALCAAAGAALQVRDFKESISDTGPLDLSRVKITQARDRVAILGLPRKGETGG